MNTAPTTRHNPAIITIRLQDMWANEDDTLSIDLDDIEWMSDTEETCENVDEIPPFVMDWDEYEDEEYPQPRHDTIPHNQCSTVGICSDR